MALAFGKNQDCTAFGEQAGYLAKCLAITRRVERYAVRLPHLVADPPQRYDVQHPEQKCNQRVVGERSLRGHGNPAGHYPPYDQRIDESILMVDCNQ